MQVHATLLLDSVEQYEKAQQQADQKRRDIAAMGWLRYAELFPEYVPESARIATEEDIDRALAENEQGETGEAYFDFSQADPITEEEASRVLQEMMAGISSGSVNLDAAAQEGWV